VVAAFKALVRKKLQSRMFVAVAVLLITVVSGAFLPFLKFDGRIDVMLPDRSELRDLFTFLREIQVADKVLVTFAMRDASADPDTLMAAADRYAAGLDPAFATPMNTGFRTEEIVKDFTRLARQMPDYTEEADFERLGADTSAAGLRGALEALRRRVQQPEGMFAASAAQADPLDWNGRTVKQLLAAVASFGYRAVPVQQHLMDPERRHLLMILQTPVLMTDSAGVRRLLKHLETRAAGLPPGVEARLVCGHLHTAGNEAIIRRDIQITGAAVTVVFLVLFLGVYRDWRAIGVVLIPFLASLPALALAASAFGSFSYIVVGFGSVIAGIAIDYGIHTYVTARGAQAERNLKQIRLPVTLSALTTLCVFVAFCFSSIPAYRQLGLFASLAILISLAYALWVLPLFVKKAEPGAATMTTFGHSRSGAWVIVILAGVGFATGLGLVFRLKLDPDVSKLDGTPAVTLNEEKRAMAIWGGGESVAAILCVDAADEEAALRLNDRVYAGLLAAGVEASAISSLSPIGPSDETRRARRLAWSAYWTDVRAQTFRENLEREAAALDFSEQAFQAFWGLFASWRESPADRATEPIGFLKPLRDRFVHSQEGLTRVTTFVPDEPRYLAAAARLRQDIPSLRVISKNAFSTMLSGAISREVSRISLLAALMIVAITVALIRRAGMVLLSLVPAVTGLVWGGAGMALLGQPVNISNLIAGIIVLGLCIDYGICMVYAHRRGMRRDVFRAVTLSAVTTVLGAGVLLLARHPAFFSIGVTLVSGVSAGYLCAWLALPALQTVWPRLNPPAAAADEEEGAA
jgi:predicted exporter